MAIQCTDRYADVYWESKEEGGINLDLPLRNLINGVLLFILTDLATINVVGIVWHPGEQAIESPASRSEMRVCSTFGGFSH